MNSLKINGRQIYYAEYQSRYLAESAMSHTVKPMHLLLGDNGRYWIVKPADAQRLERAGYEYAN